MISSALDLALRLWLEDDEDAPLIERCRRAARADIAGHRCDRGILEQDVDQRLLALGHRGEGDILRGLGDADDLSGILLREESLRNDHIEIAGQRDGGEHHHQRCEAVTQHDAQAARVQREQAIETPLEQQIELVMLLARLVLQQARAHHRRQRQRDDQRQQQRGGDGDGKFLEQLSDIAAHQEQRNEHGDQRQRDGNDREADLARSP